VKVEATPELRDQRRIAGVEVGEWGASAAGQSPQGHRAEAVLDSSGRQKVEVELVTAT
jgi:hypothetical protein